MDSNLNIVCYAGGTCGDLVSALIDPTDARLDTENKRVMILPVRSMLKKPFLFNSIQDKDSYVSNMGKQYKSIPSHDAEYHISKKHPFIGIAVSKFETAMWAAKRFKNLHDPQVWDKLCTQLSINTTEQYASMILDFNSLMLQHSTHLIFLEEILDGKLIERLEDIRSSKLPANTNEFYTNWLSLCKLN